MYRINDADVPRQRPSTPEEETIDRVVERIAPAWFGSRENGRADFILGEASPC